MASFVGFGCVVYVLFIVVLYAEVSTGCIVGRIPTQVIKTHKSSTRLQAS